MLPPKPHAAAAQYGSRYAPLGDLSYGIIFPQAVLAGFMPYTGAGWQTLSYYAEHFSEAPGFLAWYLEWKDRPVQSRWFLWAQGNVANWVQHVADLSTILGLLNRVDLLQRGGTLGPWSPPAGGTFPADAGAAVPGNFPNGVVPVNAVIIEVMAQANNWVSVYNARSGEAPLAVPFPAIPPGASNVRPDGIITNVNRDPLTGAIGGLDSYTVYVPKPEDVRAPSAYETAVGAVGGVSPYLSANAPNSSTLPPGTGVTPIIGGVPSWVWPTVLGSLVGVLVVKAVK